MKNPFVELSAEDWENFAEDVLYHLGYSIDLGPALGQDQGKDLIVIKSGRRYLVSCKHHQKAIGVSQEVDIRDRLEMHKCQGFIAFYSSSVTAGLQKKFIALREHSNSYEVLEFSRSNILNVIPTMMGLVLAKYFKEPHKLYHHVNENMNYKPLPCLNCSCEDIFSKGCLPLSMVTLYKKDNELHFEYGCKSCIGDYPAIPFLGEISKDIILKTIMNYEEAEIYWMELSQIRFFEEFFEMRDLIDICLEKLTPAQSFYKNFSKFHTALMQVMVPQGWGVWFPKEYRNNMRVLMIL